MTRTSMTRALLAAVLCTMAFAAGAQDVVAPASDASPAEKRAQAEDEALNDRNCLRETGSRIATRIKPRADNRDTKRCVSATGRSYSGEELRRTGRWDLADALRSLDPAVH